MGRHREPRLEVVRPVTNIDQVQFDAIWHEVEKVESFAEVRRERVLVEKLGKGPKLISQQELYKLRQKTGRHPQIDELGKFLNMVLPSSFKQGVTVDTFPGQVHTTPARKRRVLTFGLSPELLQERHHFKKLVGHFYKLETVPEGVWLNDEMLSSVTVARSDTVASLHVLKFLGGMLKEGTDLLPPVLELGPVEVRVKD